ncbi:MAG: hypothetical protein ACI4U2_03075, partial [Christensenellaceae bacterium]
VEVYVSASRYPLDAAEYSPLKLSIEGEQLGELVATVMRLADIDFSLFNDLLTSDFLAKLDGLRSGSIGIDDAINDTINGVIDSVPVPEGETISIQSGRLNDYLKTLSIADGQLSIVLDSAKVFGQSGLEDLSITVGVDEENRLNAFGFRGVHLLSDGPTEHLNASFTMNCEPFAFGAPSDLDLYIDVTGTMDLVEELVSSAVHSGPEGYVGNEEFAISGTATMTILWYDVSTNISMQLSMGDSSDTALKFRFVTSGKRLIVDLVKGDTVTDVTIRFPDDGPAAVYMERKQTTYFNWLGIKKKYATPLVERRTMSLDEFMDDILGQIGFIFNLGDVLLDAMNSESATEENSNDYGNYLKSFTMASDQYTIVLDGGNLTGGVLGTLKLGVRRDNGLIGGVNINTSIYTILKLNADLSYLNAGDNYENVPANFTRDLVAEGVF